ncbi:MAG: O-antigen ligase family protein [Planctomycetia bacterium]|nr:O-antigen ligase family protein [Planctomycetia bacterium]
MKGYLFVYTLTILGMVGALFSPYMGICIYVLFGVLAPNALWYYSLDETFLNSGLGFSEVVAYPTIVGWTLNHFGNLNIGKATLPLVCLAGYSCWVLFSLTATGWNPYGWVQILMNVRLLLAILIVLSLCDTLRRLRIFVWILIFSFGFVAFELNMSYLQGFNRLQMTGYAGMDNNFFAVSMVVGAVLAFFTGLAEKNIALKGIAFFAAVLQAHVIMFSMSRGGMLGLLIAFVFTVIVIPKNAQNLTLIFIGAIIGVAIWGPTPRERFMTAFANMEDLDGSAMSRLTSWKNCAIVMKERPVFGVGVKNWTSYSTNRFGLFLEAHSTWFQTAVDSGIPALLFLLGFFGFTIIRTLPYIFGGARAPDPMIDIYMQMVFVACVSYCLSAQFVSLYAMEGVFYTATIGLVGLKLTHLKKLEDDRRETEEMLEMQRDMGYSYTR